jgi:hypothetical protein
VALVAPAGVLRPGVALATFVAFWLVFMIGAVWGAYC